MRAGLQNPYFFFVMTPVRVTEAFRIKCRLDQVSLTMFYTHAFNQMFYSTRMSVLRDIGAGTLHWFTSCLGPSCFFKMWSKEIFFVPNFAEKKIMLYFFSYKVIFSMSKVHFWFFSFIKTKSLNIDSFTNENKNKFVSSGQSFSGEKKSLLLIRYYK